MRDIFSFYHLRFALAVSKIAVNLMNTSARLKSLTLFNLSILRRFINVKGLHQHYETPSRDSAHAPVGTERTFERPLWLLSMLPQQHHIGAGVTRFATISARA
jgi:hypothetical protein